MSQSQDSLTEDGLALYDWLTSLVLDLPRGARSSLKLEQLPVIGFTDVRDPLAQNQDRIAVAYRTEKPEELGWFLAIACDGVGGSVHGERAAALTIAAMAIEMGNLSRLGATEALRECLLKAHEKVVAAFQGRSSTTVTAVLVTQTDAVIGWVGDSRVYEISAGKVNLLTLDDTLAGALAKANLGIASELSDEYGERLSQAVGGGNSIHPNVIDWRSSGEDAVCILCTDGVWKPIQPVFSILAENCNDSAELMRRLLIQSDWLGGIDNASAVLTPSIKNIRRFLSAGGAFIPNSFALSLPGPTTVLVPVRTANRVQTKANSGASLKDAKRQKINSKKAVKEKSPDANEYKSSFHSPKQLVIEEEPVNDPAPESSGKI